MTEGVLTSDRILEAAEEVLRRYGPGKTTVVDVAQALGVSHGAVYRHFPSKAALRDAVTERWLARLVTPLEAVVAKKDPSPKRIRRWLELLIASKHQKALEDPELFATYVALAADSRVVVQDHVEHLVGQLRRIIADGVEQNELDVSDPDTAARAVFDATTRFHNPVHAAQWTDPAIDASFERVWELVVRGLGASTRDPRR